MNIVTKFDPSWVRVIDEEVGVYRVRIVKGCAVCNYPTEYRHIVNCKPVCCLTCLGDMNDEV
jgi:hypothetical protein